MESFWDAVRDFLLMVLKVFLGLVIVQLILHLGKFELQLPYLSELVAFVLSFVGF